MADIIIFLLLFQFKCNHANPDECSYLLNLIRQSLIINFVIFRSTLFTFLDKIFNTFEDI